MDYPDLNMAYLQEPGIDIPPPVEMAENYIKGNKTYRECIKKGYFTKLDLVLFFATFKANSDATTISAKSGQLVDVKGLDDAADRLLSEQLHMELKDVRNIGKKINDGFNKLIDEKRAKTKKSESAPAGICIEQSSLKSELRPL